MPDNCQEKTNNPIEVALERLLTDADPEPHVPAEPKRLAYADALAIAKARVAADEAHNAKRLHTRNKRPYRETGATIDEWRKTPEGKAARSADQRDGYAAMIEATQHRPVATYNKNPTVEDRKAQQRAASKTYRLRKKAEKEAREAAVAAEAEARIAARALF